VLTTLPPPVSRLSRQFGILSISQPYRPPRRVIGIALLYNYTRNLVSRSFGRCLRNRLFGSSMKFAIRSFGCAMW
jgi:hypothetical protein